MEQNVLIYLIGTSGSGKTTIANALAKELKSSGSYPFQVIDGDMIRQQFGDIFGYTYEERMKCNRVVRVVISYLLKNGISVILAQVAPYEEMRAKVREQFEPQYIEVYVKCSIEECMRRDVKGYYQRHSQKAMKNLNGINDRFDIPQNSDLVINTEKETVESAVQKILRYLEERTDGLSIYYR